VNDCCYLFILFSNHEEKLIAGVMVNIISVIGAASKNALIPWNELYINLIYIRVYVYKLF